MGKSGKSIRNVIFLSLEKLCFPASKRSVKLANIRKVYVLWSVFSSSRQNHQHSYIYRLFFFPQFPFPSPVNFFFAVSSNSPPSLVTCLIEIIEWFSIGFQIWKFISASPLTFEICPSSSCRNVFTTIKLSCHVFNWFSSNQENIWFWKYENLLMKSITQILCKKIAKFDHVFVGRMWNWSCTSSTPTAS